MAASKLMPLYEQIAGRIQQEIESGQFAPGQRIYSIREICERFDVADVTAKSALRRLRQRGVVRTVNGAGAYVQSPRTSQAAAPPTVRQTVALLKVGQPPAAVFTAELDLIQQELFKFNHPLTYTVAAMEDQDVPRFIEHVKQTHAGCLIVFPTHAADFESAPYMPALRDTNLPLLVIESRSSRDAYVTTNTERATRDLVEYLYDEGHRRICLATSFGRKVAGFNDAVARLNDPQLKTWIIGESGKTDQDTHELARRILSLSPRPTAVIGSDDHAAAVIISHFLGKGLRVPEDISVATFGDHPQLAGLSPIPVTVMRHPFVEVAQEVTQWAHRQLTRAGGRSRIRREITGTLIIRESTGPAPRDD